MEAVPLRGTLAPMGKASRRKQELYQGVDGQGRPLFPQDGSAAVSLLGVPVSWVLILVDESTNRTVAAGMIVRESAV